MKKKKMEYFMHGLRKQFGRTRGPNTNQLCYKQLILNGPIRHNILHIIVPLTYTLNGQSKLVSILSPCRSSHYLNPTPHWISDMLALYHVFCIMNMNTFSYKSPKFSKSLVNKAPFIQP